MKLGLLFYEELLLIFITSGILAGMRPCGIILLLAELFTSESKSQVYANLHEYLRKYPNVAENISKLYNWHVQ